MRIVLIFIPIVAYVSGALFEDPTTIDENKNVTGRTQKGNATALWPNGIVYFYFDKLFTSRMRDLFYTAIEAWEMDTCIDFKRRKRVTDKILVVEEDHYGCSSRVGKVGGEQIMNLNRDCAHFGGFAHEIGHALGLEHTHRRHDRNNYITMNWKNIEKQFERRYSDMFNSKDKEKYMKQYKMQFEEFPTNESDHGPYDLGSIMHYSSPTQNPTMTPKEILHRRTMGSPLISFADLLAVNELYNCKAMCESKQTANCSRGGFPHPRHCDMCICPRGYGGSLCNKKPGKCGVVLNASTEWQKLRYERKNGKDFENGFHMCTYWIEAPSDRKIEIEIQHIDASTSEGCQKAGVEIKANEDQTLTGYRFCDREDTGVNFISYTNITPIIFYEYEYENSFIITTLKYRHVSSAEKTHWQRFREWLRRIFGGN